MDTHELALDALVNAVRQWYDDEYIWSDVDVEALRDAFEPLVIAISDLGSDYGPDVWDAARSTLVNSLRVAERRAEARATLREAAGSS